MADPLCRIVADLHHLIFPRDLFRLLREQRITALPLMPVIITRMFDPQLPGPLGEMDFSALRYVSTTGAPVSVRMLDHLRKTFPATDIVLMYGLTEAFRSSWLPPDQLSARPTSIGKAIPEVELYVLDRQGRIVPQVFPATRPSRWLRSQGYWNAPKRQRTFPANGPLSRRNGRFFR